MKHSMQMGGGLWYRQLQLEYSLKDILQIEKTSLPVPGLQHIGFFGNFFFLLIFGFYSTTWGQKMGDNVSPLESLYHNQVQKYK